MTYDIVPQSTISIAGFPITASIGSATYMQSTKTYLKYFKIG